MFHNIGIGSIIQMKMEYSSDDEEITQIKKKKKLKDQASIRNYFSKKII